MESAHTSMPLTRECQVKVERYRISLSIQHYNAIYIGNNCCCNNREAFFEVSHTQDSKSFL